MRPRSTSTRKGVSPAVSVVIIILALGVVGIAGYFYFRPTPRKGATPPQMSPEVEKARMAESMAWGEELKRAEREHRLPDYSKLPRSGHSGAPGAPVPAGR